MSNESCTREEARALIVDCEGEAGFDKFLVEVGDRCEYGEREVLAWLGFIECCVVGKMLIPLYALAYREGTAAARIQEIYGNDSSSDAIALIEGRNVKSMPTK